jgi:hypothetical protein
MYVAQDLERKPRGVLPILLLAFGVAVALSGLGCRKLMAGGRPPGFRSESTTNGTVVACDNVEDCDGDGVVDVRSGAIRRGTCMVYSYQVDKGRRFAVREYSPQGRRVLQEIDADCDGHFEMLFFFGDEMSEPVEVFFRDGRGKVFMDEAKAESIRRAYRSLP